MNVESALRFGGERFYNWRLLNVGRGHSRLCAHDAIAAAGVARA